MLALDCSVALPLTNVPAGIRHRHFRVTHTASGAVLWALELHGFAGSDARIWTAITLSGASRRAIASGSKSVMGQPAPSTSHDMERLHARDEPRSSTVCASADADLPVSAGDREST
jgi:hypothetical protein